MKTKYIFASLLVSSLAVTGCQDMDTLPDGGIVTDSQKETVSTLNPEKLMRFSLLSTRLFLTQVHWELNVITILVILLSCCVWILIQKT